MPVEPETGDAEMLSAAKPSRWRWRRLLGYVAIVVVVYLATSTLAFAAVAIWYGRTQPGFDLNAWAAERAGSDGFALSVSVCATAVTSLPLIGWLVGRREPRRWDFLGFRRVSRRDVVYAILATAAFITVSDLMSLALGRPIVPSFLVDAYTSARWPALLFVAVTIVAPFLEEVLFRGFLFGGLRACGVPTALTVLIVSATFAAIHTQYDAYDVTGVFLLGLLFAAVRARVDSVIPCIAMHSLANTVAFAEMLLMPGAV